MYHTIQHYFKRSTKPKGKLCLPRPLIPGEKKQNILDEIKIHILRQDKKNLNIKFFSAHLASSLPSGVHRASALRVNQTSPVTEIPAQP